MERSLAELSGNANEKFGWRGNWMEMIVNIARRRGTIDERSRGLIFFPFFQFVLQTEQRSLKLKLEIIDCN